MPPIDGHMMPSGPQGGNTIPLATLIDYSIQRTYHELNVLSELLPRKTDMERKIEIVQFASRSRQLFIRLLALVKWASSATKVDKCGEICQFLEQQSMWFVDTADMLAKMARETLVNARLPNFSLPCAIDVLTLGTYPRLPTCIREKIVPIDPITPAEKADTLHKLTQVIQYRLVSTDLPQQMRKLRVENGRVKFLVEHEFEVTLTLMGDSAAIPWRLLDINILVEDPETGDGKSLVHSLQVNFIHQLAQSRLLENDKPLHDLYRVLHSFCQSLQLEVLHSQTQRLIRERMGDSIRVEDYTVGRCLVVSYWRDQLKKEKVQEPVVYKLKVHVCEEDGGKPLQINHSPVMAPEESTRVGLAIKSNHLSIERLLMQTIEVRTHAKLKDLSKDLQKYVDGKCDLRDLPIALQVPILNPSMDSEQLRIMVDSQRGTLRAHIPVSSDLQVRQDIEECLNIEQKGLNKHIVNLRLHLCLLRCEKSAQYLPTSCQRHLPLVNLTNHPLEKLTKHQLFIRIPKQSCHYLVVELDEKKNKDVDYRYYILETTPCTADGTEDFIAEDIGAKLYLKAGRLIPLDSFSFTHGPYTRVFDEEEETELQTLRRKRKILLGQLDEPKTKKAKGSAYFIPELAYILASCEERIPFVALGSEFERNGIVHSGVQVDSQGTCFCLSVVSMPDVDDCSKKTNEGIKKLVLSIKVRVLSKPSRNWIIEYSFARSSLQSANKKEQGPLQRVTYMYELNIDNIQKMVKEMLDEWSAICHLYSIIEEFSEIYNDSRTGLQATVNIHSYNFRRLTLVYGPNKTSIANIQWKSDSKQFYINFGTIGQCTTINPHVVMATQLIQELNCTRSLTQVAQILHDTWSPMTSINKLSTGITLASTSNPKQQTPCFSIVPQSTTHIRIAFRSVSCVDVHFKSNKIVAIRDGAYSLFDNSKAVDGFNPTPMLKAFLNTFVDDAVSGRHMRRISTTEDDNPPSPVGIDSMDVFNMSQPPSMGSPASRRQDGGLRFPSPMTPPSNPHTPASPSAARMSSATVTPSPSAALIGTPSPGNVLGVGSPGNPPLHVPSPGSFVPAPSPQSMGIQMQSPASSFISPQGMVEGGSPYPNTGLAMPSPGQRYWSNSPSVPGPSPASRQGTAMSPGHPALHSPQTQSKDGGDHKTSVMPHPSRILPQRSWAASFPTLISHEAFDNLLTPNKLQPMPFSVLTSPLERFLGCVFLRRHLPRIIQNLDQLRQLPTTEAHVVTFKVESLQFRVNFNMTTLQTLHMNVTPVPEYRDQWPAEVTQILEKFFDYKVACPPYKVNALTAFCRLLSIPFKILKDCIQIMRLELIPDTNMKWSVQWCLTIPPTGAFVAAAGTTAVAVTAKNKMVLMLQLTRIGLQLPQGVEPQSVIVQLIYDFNNNTIQPMEPKTPSPQQNTPAQNMISQMLKRFSDYHQNSSECAIYPAVRDLMTNFVAPPV